MRSFFIRLVLFLILPLPLLFYFNHIIDSGLRKSRNEYYSEWNDIFDGKINADLLILGTSRAWVHFSPQILDTCLHINSYNLGLDGAPFYSQFKRLRIYLKHNKKPRYIIQEISPNGTLLDSHMPPNIEQFFPYLDDSDMWQMYSIYFRDDSSKILPPGFINHYFPLYKYNNELPLIKEGIMSYFGKGEKSKKYKGYEGKDLPFYSSADDSKNGPPLFNCNVDDNAMKEFISYLEFCKQNDIHVILVQPPFYYPILTKLVKIEKFNHFVDSVSEAYHIPYLSLANDSIGLDKSNFYNYSHLNRKGSVLFSLKLANEIKKYIQ